MTIMQNEIPNEAAVQEVIQRYAPVSGAPAGLLGKLLGAFSSVADSKEDNAGAPTPGVIYRDQNLAGQVIATSNVELAKTFKRMESALAKSFTKATGEGASAEDRLQFVALTQQVEKDAAILAAACLITKPEGPAKYKFTLEPKPGQHIPLKEAFAAVKQEKKGPVRDVEFLRFGTEARQVVMMRPAGGFRKASHKQPTA
jgi:hypothetical protein